MQLNNQVCHRLPFFCGRWIRRLLLQSISNILNSSLTIIVIVMKSYAHHHFHRSVHHFTLGCLLTRTIIVDMICVRLKISSQTWDHPPVSSHLSVSWACIACPLSLTPFYWLHFAVPSDSCSPLHLYLPINTQTWWDARGSTLRVSAMKNWTASSCPCPSSCKRRVSGGVLSPATRSTPAGTRSLRHPSDRSSPCRDAGGALAARLTGSAWSS